MKIETLFCMILGSLNITFCILHIIEIIKMNKEMKRYEEEHKKHLEEMEKDKWMIN